MVNHRERLDAAFSALGHETRRRILHRLERGNPVSISSIAKPLSVKLPALLKHLSVLENAQMIKRQKIGRTVYVSVDGGFMADAMAWLRRYERFWAGGLDRLVAYAERDVRSKRVIP